MTIFQSILNRIKKMNNNNTMKSFDKREKRIIIIHNHAFKNAGTTIDWVLRSNFGDGFFDHRDDKNMVRGSEYLGPYLEKNTWISALSTHHLRPPLPELDNSRLLSIMMLRHPIERVTSVYSFERKQVNATTLGARFARDHDLREYVLWRMSFDVPPTIRNFHIYRSIPLPVNWKKPLNETQIMQAREYVNSLEMLGLVERFDESMVLFEETLRPFFPNIDLSYKRQNVGQKVDETKEERIARLMNTIGDEVFNMLCERNKEDLNLYDYANAIFDERLSKITSFDVKLEDFKNRCKNQIDNN